MCGVAGAALVLSINDFANRQTSDEEPYDQYEVLCAAAERQRLPHKGGRHA